jgi:anti-sigma regulatory factor (Ser/Thr protein kinase)
MALDVASVSNYITGRSGTHIDLAQVDFVSPGGIVAVACAARSAMDRGESVTVTPPVRASVARYASRMGLGATLADCGVHADLPAVHHHDRTDTLLECQYADDGSIADLSSLVGQRLYDAGVDHETIEPLDICLWEVADNVCTHARAGGGFICAQTYMRGTDAERVEVSIGDTGVGIPVTLRDRHSPTSDQHALELATTKSVSRLPSERRGLGLHYLARDIPKAGGQVTIRSGSALRTIFPGGPYSTDVPSISGTLVQIQLPVARLKAGGSR